MIVTALFFACGICTLYVLFGYPLGLAYLSARRARDVHRGSTLRTVSVILPVHNGAAFLRAKLDSLLQLDYPAHLLEILVISDGSTDDTGAIVAEYVSRSVQFYSIPRSGKAAALNVGIAHARNEILFMTDVRQKLHANALRVLVSAFDDPSVGVASGELVILNGDTQEEESISLYRRYENQLRRHLSRIDSVFGATGCIYAMRRELAVPIPEETLLDDVYLPLAAFFRGFRLIFDEHARAYDYPTALGVEFSRKVRTLAGNIQVMRAYPQLLTGANRMWGHFLSYKLGRLLLPWLVAVIVISSFFLMEPLRSIAIAAELLTGTIVVLDPIIPDGFPLKRICSFLRTFCILIAAAACAPSILFRPPRTLWKTTQVATSRKP